LEHSNFSNRMRVFRRAIAAGLLLALASAGCARRHAAAETGRAREMVVRRGEFRERFVLTGELDAVRADQIVVPRTPAWVIAIRWMEADGATVEAGQKVLELDNTAFAGDLEERKLARAEAESDLERATADARAQAKDREFTLEERRVALETAKIRAAVPEEIQDRRKYQESQLALQRAEVDFAKAREDLDAYRASSRADLENRRLTVEKARREIATAETSIEALTLRAPRAGILVVADNPWEDRKFQVGDTAYVGWTVMKIPDLGAMRVEAQLSDVDDGRIAAGMTASCTLDTYPEIVFPGKVVELTPVAQEPARQSLRRAFRVLVDLETTDPERMRPGMSAKVEVEVLLRAGALLAPRAALDRGASPARALLSSGAEAEVRLGPCNAQECVVEGGLAEGTRLRSRG
jgi:multidrug resistance efflux pump